MNIDELTPGIYKTKTDDNYDSELPSGYIEIYEHPYLGLAYCDDKHDGEFYDCHLPLIYIVDNIDYKLSRAQIKELKKPKI